ncbi:uncharacterized protein LOC123315459 [Coccinella septempunctata]|uniref:uncharacterized protein LOC123315459 n=1 Tax=Coccinella septempunctata TaxID=41139 RepID=UPI001D0666F7|nr:uncharacterized protein LOC123315459 [Coccinella septempunctata]
MKKVTMKLLNILCIINMVIYVNSLTCFVCGSAKEDSCKNFDFSVNLMNCTQKDSKCFSVTSQFRLDGEKPIAYDRGCTSAENFCSDYKEVYGSNRVTSCEECMDAGCNTASM